ncbi:MAG TPA: hypothetical protein VHH34_22570, partial [Pseudonocardiaceae bacterium]|nr:hypothetical protein [Pseudonocardiaceae bacterium]
TNFGRGDGRTGDARHPESPVRPFQSQSGGRALGTVMQRENEISRVVLEGRRTDDGAVCSVVVVHELGGTWAIFPHGMSQFGVRLHTGEMATLAQAVLTVVR